jgi:hypothetical protein
MIGRRCLIAAQMRRYVPPPGDFGGCQRRRMFWLCRDALLQLLKFLHFKLQAKPKSPCAATTNTPPPFDFMAGR